MKNVYFIADAHLGSLATEHKRTQERRLVRFLDDIKDKAEAVYMLGDMFDFWYEYRYAVPKGYTRFLGKISELTDMGVEVHFFTGNHDIWAYSYLREECGVILHRRALTTEINGNVFYLAHGDQMGEKTFGFRFIQSIFHSKICQTLFSSLHPRWGIDFGLKWAKHSRLKREDGKEPPYLGEDKETLVQWSKEFIKQSPEINYFIFGHRHIELDLYLSKTTRLLILGDWISQYTYAVYDGKNIELKDYLEGDFEK